MDSDGFEWDIPANRTTWSPELYRIFGVTPEHGVSSRCCAGSIPSVGCSSRGRSSRPPRPAAWRGQYPERAPVRVAVNLSARQVARLEITDAVERRAFAQGYLFSPPVTAEELGSLRSENGNTRRLARR